MIGKLRYAIRALPAYREKPANKTHQKQSIVSAAKRKRFANLRNGRMILRQNDSVNSVWAANLGGF
jgi:hypothetical protein